MFVYIGEWPLERFFQHAVITSSSLDSGGNETPFHNVMKHPSTTSQPGPESGDTTSGPSIDTENRRLPATTTGRQPVRFTFNGQELEAFQGDSVAAALAAADQRVLRWTARRGEPRALFCNMGICFDCLVEIDGCPGSRACCTRVTEGMSVRSQRGNGVGESDT